LNCPISDVSIAYKKLSYRRDEYGSIFIHIFVVGSNLKDAALLP